jgi:hypothetical protein
LASWTGLASYRDEKKVEAQRLARYASLTSTSDRAASSWVDEWPWVVLLASLQLTDFFIVWTDIWTGVVQPLLIIELGRWTEGIEEAAG